MDPRIHSDCYRDEGISLHFPIFLIATKHSNAESCLELQKLIHFLKHNQTGKFCDSLTKMPILFTKLEMNTAHYALCKQLSRIIFISPDRITRYTKDELIQMESEGVFHTVDTHLTLSQSLCLNDVQEWGTSWPAILAIQKDLSCKTLHIGNGPGVYGHFELLEYCKVIICKADSSISVLQNDLRRIDHFIQGLIEKIQEESLNDHRFIHLIDNVNKGKRKEMCYLKYLPIEIRERILDNLAFKDVEMLAQSSIWKYTICVWWMHKIKTCLATSNVIPTCDSYELGAEYQSRITIFECVNELKLIRQGALLFLQK